MVNGPPCYILAEEETICIETEIDFASRSLARSNQETTYYTLVLQC